MNIDLSHIALQLETAVREAGGIIRTQWNEPRRIQHKGRIDLVTQTDIAVEKALQESLSRILPEADFLGEESAESLDVDGLTWVVDPLDGTTNYAHKLPFVATSVALWTGEEVGVGAIFNPILEEMFIAVRGQGAFRNGERIHVTDTDSLQDGLVATGFPYDADQQAGRIAVWLEKVLARSRGVRRYGSAALDLAYLSCGNYDAYYEINLKPWDLAAGWLLVEEAGGRVSEFDPNAPFSLFSSSVLATNGPLHETMRELLV
ncbi:inositol monophosphatase family protein [Oceanidesulfovibrio indonesiensis]|uniref:inositol monophosphatase family protein n=1 Tax=Oceanidesulfovibrio indonesiensis TaxID=54767 RepID=UPI0027BA5C8F|nr:inositol monophosphatase family protein [Oceanidesulfovibrio indonesiensis]